MSETPTASAPVTLTLATLSTLAQEGDRFGIYVRPLPNGESQIAILANEPGVLYAEVVHHLVKALGALTRTPLADVVTVEQTRLARRRERVTQEYPAVRRLFLPLADGDDDQRVSLSSAGLDAVRSGLLAHGWRDGGVVRKGDAPVPCDYMLDPEAFHEKYLDE